MSQSPQRARHLFDIDHQVFDILFGNQIGLIWLEIRYVMNDVSAYAADFHAV
jgi:hypothetical protein